MIIHVDMDAFFASVEQLDRPKLRGKPVIVGGSVESRGVVSAASYEARRFGVHSAMPMSQALRRCPDGVFVPLRMSRYAEISDQIHEIFNRYTPMVEAISLDEAFLDVSGCEKLFGAAESIARKIKREIRDELGLVASAGVATNKFLAKVASDLEKPDGLVVVPTDQEAIESFLEPLPIRRIWGVGKVAAERFHRIGVRTIGQLRRLSLSGLTGHFGESTARHFYDLARGRDGRDVIPYCSPKSISHETTFPKDESDPKLLRTCLLELTDQVACRLRAKKLFAKSVHLKVRFADFRTVTRSSTLPTPTNRTDKLSSTAVEILEHRLPAKQLPVRLIGIGVGHLTETAEVQLDLFDRETNPRQKQLDRATDEIRDRFGNCSIRRGGSL